MSVYDTAVRIGARLGVEPSKIYLHRGTRAGAAALKLNTKRRALDLDELPIDLRILTAREAEDVLCIYKHELAIAVRDGSLNGPMAAGCEPQSHKIPSKSC